MPKKSPSAPKTGLPTLSAGAIALVLAGTQACTTPHKPQSALEVDRAIAELQHRDPTAFCNAYRCVIRGLSLCKISKLPMPHMRMFSSLQNEQSILCKDAEFQLTDICSNWLGDDEGVTNHHLVERCRESLKKKIFTTCRRPQDR